MPSAALILAGILHLLPLAGVLGPDRLATMYGITVDEPNVLILMRMADAEPRNVFEPVNIL